ncbi:MAG: polymer-forming cytoskeletal protein [Rhizobiales bacterium]|nr:polymer-forming cytoskeletal protein [Hyphomicrobiales bacterium]
MFSRNKDKELDKPAVSQVMAPPPAAQAAGKRPGPRTAPSIISSDLVVHGNMTATGDIQVDGTVEGDIRSQSLTIGEKASITGEVVAEDIVIRGRVIGTIRGRRVQLASTCHVEGDILHEALAVETGAFFEGNCRHSDDPIGHAGNVARPSLRPTSNAGVPPVPGQTAATNLNSSSSSSGPAGSRPAPAPRPSDDSPVVVNDGGVVVKRPAAQ